MSQLFEHSCSTTSVTRVTALTILDCTIPAVPEVPELAPSPIAFPPINVPGCAQMKFKGGTVSQGSSSSDGSVTMTIENRGDDYCSPDISINIKVPKFDADTDCLFHVTNNSGRSISFHDILGVDDIDYKLKTAKGVVPTAAHYSRFGVAVEEIAAGAVGLCLLCGIVEGVSVNVQDDYSSGAGAIAGSTSGLKSGMQGASIVDDLPATGQHDLTIELHLGGGANNKTAKDWAPPVDDALTYIIDRSNTADNTKTWPPAGGQAAMLAYTKVKLILPFFVYTPGTGVERFNQELYWTAALAPAILAVSRETQELTSCD